MENFINDFMYLFNNLMTCIKYVFNWITSTIIGEIFLFAIVIGIFISIINLIIDFKGK